MGGCRERTSGVRVPSDQPSPPFRRVVFFSLPRITLAFSPHLPPPSGRNSGVGLPCSHLSRLRPSWPGRSGVCHIAPARTEFLPTSQRAISRSESGVQDRNYREFGSRGQPENERNNRAARVPCSLLSRSHLGMAFLARCSLVQSIPWSSSRFLLSNVHPS